MLRTLLVCGLIAGAAGGVLVTGFAQVTGEPAISRAESFEYAQRAAAHQPPEMELVPRRIQRSFGLLTAAVVYGLSFGGLFALTFAAVYGRVGRASPARTALWLALAAFVVLYLVPLVKYPANPPSVGNPDTIQRRTELYLLMMGSSLAAALAAVRVRAALARRIDGGGATLLALALYLAVVVVAGLALPGVHEVPRGFPAETLWRFRESSIGMQAVMWTTIGLVFAGGAQRAMTGRRIVPRPAELRAGWRGREPAGVRRD
jgi:predicted cobalt transporter CbtA